MDDVSVAGPCLGKIKHSVLVTLMAKHYDDDMARGGKSRKHKESFVEILFHM